MFCTECGYKLPDGSKFCSSCGAHIQGGNQNASGKCKLIVERVKCFFSYATFKYNLYIDGELVKKLSNKECFSIVLCNGKHNIYLNASGISKTESYEFTGNNNEIKYTVSSPTTSDIISGFDGNSPHRLIVNKISESMPGSFKG